MPEHPVAPDELLLRIFRDEADAETARQAQTPGLTTYLVRGGGVLSYVAATSEQSAREGHARATGCAVGNAEIIRSASVAPALPAPAPKRIRDLKVGDHFLHGGFEGWIVQTNERYIRARRVGTFDEDRIYFDALTAAKAGEFSWDSEVEEYQPPPDESPFLLLARAIRLLAPQITQNGALDARALGVARDLEQEYRRVR